MLFFVTGGRLAKVVAPAREVSAEMHEIWDGFAFVVKYLLTDELLIFDIIPVPKLLMKAAAGNTFPALGHAINPLTGVATVVATWHFLTVLMLFLMTVLMWLFMELFAV